ncbi:hypothetical protein RFI_32875 [Reticulomyxa filosa]|uniref:C2H2-type domain-containing protein n=1 Tax=Reticulomyxa filosa TaxID=46433 RepID=X6LRL8_RETFI|nr:hypothetical protein RFI_32875 [Reticulomyxa filosa]|eukprot:ETO04523.1 hypothetical protein RFI_32875 [Reticulomyxa filosa]
MANSSNIDTKSGTEKELLELYGSEWSEMSSEHEDHDEHKTAQTNAAMTSANLSNVRNMDQMLQQVADMEQQLKSEYARFESINNNNNNNNPNNDKNEGVTITNEDWQIIRQGILTKQHSHPLVYGVRKDCDFIICDHCSRAYYGPSWHCNHGLLHTSDNPASSHNSPCDFDLCDMCLDITKDILWSTVNPLLHVSAKSSIGSVIAIKTDKGGEINKLIFWIYKSISQAFYHLFFVHFKIVWKKSEKTTKKKEKKLGLLGLINESNTNKYDHLKDMQTLNNSDENKKQQLYGEKDFEHCLNPNQIIIDSWTDPLPVDTNLLLQWSEFNSIVDLERLGMERLKTELQIRGMKCGGTLHERASRLFLLKNSRIEDLPKHCFPQQKHSEIVS